MRETVTTSEQSLVHVINKIQGERHVTFEESTISQWLYLQLRDKVDELLVCNPTYVAEKSGAKTDFRDALHLAHELSNSPVVEFTVTSVFTVEESFVTFLLGPRKVPYGQKPHSGIIMTH